MIWLAGVFAYIGIGGFVACWLDHENQDLDPFDQVPALLYGALWLPMWLIGLTSLALSLASGAVKRRR